MPLNLNTYIDTPGAPRRAVYPDFTIGYGQVLNLDAGVTYDIGHGCNLVPVPPGLINWEVLDRPVVSWLIYALDGYGTLIIRLALQAGAFQDWRAFPLNGEFNQMEGLFIPAPYCSFRIVSSINDSAFMWLIKTQGS